MQPQMQETATAATRDKPGEAIDHDVAKPAASLNGNMVMRRSPTEAALASAEPTAARCASEAWREPGPAPVRPDDATSADRGERPAGPVRTAVAGLRALGSRLVPKPFVYAYLGFVVAILAGLKLMPELLPL